MEYNAPDEQRSWRSSPDELIKKALMENVATEWDTEGTSFIGYFFFPFLKCPMFLLWWRKLVLTKFPRIPLCFPHSLEVALGPIWLNPEKWESEESHASLLVWSTSSVSILQFHFGNGSEIYIVRRGNQRWKHFKSLSHCMEDSCLFTSDFIWAKK